MLLDVAIKIKYRSTISVTNVTMQRRTSKSNLTLPAFHSETRVYRHSIFSEQLHVPIPTALSASHFQPISKLDKKYKADLLPQYHTKESSENKATAA